MLHSDVVGLYFLMMKQIPLGKSGKFALIDDNDFERVSKYKWILSSGGYVIARYSLGERYSYGKLKMITILMHRFIMNLSEPNEFIDHKDLDKLNNQKHNLRIASNGQNQHNKRAYRNNRSGFKGVSLHKASGLYQAVIRCNCITISLGYFKCKKEAAVEYNKAALLYHGEFARLNDV